MLMKSNPFKTRVPIPETLPFFTGPIPNLGCFIEDSLRKRRIDYRIVGGIKFYDRKEIKDFLAYLRIIVNEKDALSLSRIINIPRKRNWCRPLLKNWKKMPSIPGYPLWDAICGLVRN